MIGRRWMILGASTIAVTAAVALGVEGFAAASAGQTNRREAPAPLVAAGSAVPAKATVHYYTVAASAFAPDGLHDTSEDYFNAWDATTLSNQDAGRCFNAGLYLPNGAKITVVTVYITEGSTAMYFEINRQDLANHTDVTLVTFDTSVLTTPTYTALVVPVTANNVVNTQDAYSFGACPNGNTTFSGVKIAYTG